MAQIQKNVAKPPMDNRNSRNLRSSRKLMLMLPGTSGRSHCQIGDANPMIRRLMGSNLESTDDDGIASLSTIPFQKVPSPPTVVPPPWRLWADAGRPKSITNDKKSDDEIRQRILLSILSFGLEVGNQSYRHCRFHYRCSSAIVTWLPPSRMTHESYVSLKKRFSLTIHLVDIIIRLTNRSPHPCCTPDSFVPSITPSSLTIHIPFVVKTKIHNYHFYLNQAL